MIYQFKEPLVGLFHAGRKAPSDVSTILHSMGIADFRLLRLSSKNSFLRNLGRIHWLIGFLFLPYRIVKHSICIIQYPAVFLGGRLGFCFLRMLKRTRHVRFITLIHDIYDLRNEHLTGPSDFTREIVEISDVVIDHNSRMRDWIHQYVAPGKLTVELEIFDYLIPNIKENTSRFSLGTPPTVAIAGNLEPEKSGYLKELNSIPGIVWNLYGVNYTPSGRRENNVHYKGAFSPEVLPQQLSGDFGLVWDGPTSKTCVGSFGNYLRYNNPHKLSLYVACKIPVIVWSESAEATFVQENNLGICVSSLHEIPHRLASLTKDDYKRLLMSVTSCARKLQSGYYSQRAIKSALMLLDNVL